MDKKTANLSFARGVGEELKKVTWPTRKEALRLTAAVLIISLIVGAYVGIIDVVLAQVLSLLTVAR